MPKLNFKSTSGIKVNKRVIDQVIGQDEAVNIIKKAAQQRRHVLLIGEPGTGKSMLGMGLAELLPKEKLMDIIAFPNPNDENTPLIRTVPAGKGRDLIARARIENMGMFKNQNLVMFVLVIIAMLAPWWVRSYYKSDLMFTAFFLGGMIFLGAFVIFLNLGKRMPDKIKIPKLIVDNYKGKTAPFYDGTGAHAGALLGDVLHDPFQCFLPTTKFIYSDNNILKNTELYKKIDAIFGKHKDNIIYKEGYESIFLNKNELYAFGELNGSLSPVEVLSCNRQYYDGKMIKLTTSENKELITTPEHKIAINKNGKIAYLEAKDIKEGNEIVSKAEDIMIDEQDIINTYDERQMEQCRLYYLYRDIKNKNHGWGYKRIAKAMGQKIGKTRWWHAKKHIPVPIQTANWLKEKGLLPLKINNPKLPLIAKVLGATFGDGGVFENLNGIFLSSSEKDAVEEFGIDTEKIFGLNFGENSRIIEGGEKGHSWCYQNTNRNIIRFFLALGAPRGNKTKLALEIPAWVYLQENLADEFFGSLFGGELGAPKVHKQKNRLQTLDFGITGAENLEENRLNLLNSIKRYLESKEVSSTSILKRKTRNEKLALYRLMISIKFDNVVAFIKKVKINYCKYKKEKLLSAINEFAQLKKKKYQELVSRGYGAEHAMKTLQLTQKSLYAILNEERIEA